MNRKLRPQTAGPKMQGYLAPSWSRKDLLFSEGVTDIFSNKNRELLLDKRPRSAHADISANQQFKPPVYDFNDYSNEISLFPLRLDAVPKKPSRCLCEASKNNDIKEIEDFWRLENELKGGETVFDAHNPMSRAAGTTRDVAIFPTSANFHPTPPPPPQFENPNPRRRFVQIREDVPLQNHENSASRATILKELQPALSSITKLCFEPHLGKIAIRVQSIVMVYFRRLNSNVHHPLLIPTNFGLIRCSRAAAHAVSVFTMPRSIPSSQSFQQSLSGRFPSLQSWPVVSPSSSCAPALACALSTSSRTRSSMQRVTSARTQCENTQSAATRSARYTMRCTTLPCQGSARPARWCASSRHCARVATLLRSPRTTRRC
jgi:hypothetical protein